MNSSEKNISKHNQLVFEELEKLVETFPVNIEEFETIVQKIEYDEESDQGVITNKMENILKKLLMTLLVSFIL